MSKIDLLLKKIVNPQVFTGLELNRLKKDFRPENVNICLVFPDKYEIGMSHQGLKILYHLLGKIEGVNVERSFLPDKQSAEIFKKKELPLFSLENRVALKEFDMIGISVLSELSYTNILLTLDLGGIPLKSKDREMEFPLIGIGGISASANPEPIRDFVDFVAIGDGEIIFPEIVNVIKKLKRDNLGKDLRYFDKLEGLYIPSLYEVKKRGKYFIPDLPAGSIKKRVKKKLDNNFDNVGMIVPLTEVVFNRLETEIARGCPQNCRFCQAKAYYSPFRIKNRDEIKEEYSDQLLKTGFESISLSSLSSGDHPEIESLVSDTSLFQGSCISVSLPSLRPSTLTGTMLSSISKFRKTGITIVPEAGSDRLRRVINKDVSDKEIFEAVKILISKGWQKIKLYFMIGLPTETDEDIEEIVVLVRKILDISKNLKRYVKLSLSFSPFVPKPHTAFQWVQREKISVLNERISFLREKLKIYKNVKFDFHRIDKGIVETILARGDYRTGDLLVDAFRAGETFTAWDTDFRYPVWEELIKRHNMEDFLSKLDTEEVLPWDFVDFGFKKDYLISEYKKAITGEKTLSCLDMRCDECDGCNYKFKKFKKKSDPDIDYQGIEQNVVPEFRKVRIFFSKKKGFIYFSHLSFMKYLERIIRRTGIAFRCTEGHHPRIKMAAPPPLPIYASGENEVVELFIDKSISSQEFFRDMKKRSGELEIKNVIDIGEGRKKLTGDILYSIYEYQGNIQKIVRDQILNFAFEKDEITFNEHNSDFKIYFPEKGAERFGKIYKLIDPERKNCHKLNRRGFVFESQKN